MNPQYQLSRQEAAEFIDAVRARAKSPAYVDHNRGFPGLGYFCILNMPLDGALQSSVDLRVAQTIEQQLAAHYNGLLGTQKLSLPEFPKVNVLSRLFPSKNGTIELCLDETNLSGERLLEFDLQLFQVQVISLNEPAAMPLKEKGKYARKSEYVAQMKPKGSHDFELWIGQSPAYGVSEVGRKYHSIVKKAQRDLRALVK